MALITIGRSVGKNSQNQAADVIKIGAALVEVGPDRGGLFAPPLTIEGLAEAIRSFQGFQTLPARDGRVEPTGGTLRRLNQILRPGESPAPTPLPSGTGTVKPLTDTTALQMSVNQRTFTPVETSLQTSVVFEWGGVDGGGQISYFEVDANVVPRWFGILVPNGVTSFDKAHIFFHPTPFQAGFKDDEYQSLGSWKGVFHYLSDRMGSQFCGAGTDRVLVMPLMAQSAAETCGNFPQTWESTVGRIFGMLKSGDMSSAAPAAQIASVVVSSFSSGITYSHHFRNKAKLGTRLSAVIDFDGAISSFGRHSASIVNPFGRVVRMQQMAASEKQLGVLAGHNTFPLARPRWSDVPFGNLFSKKPKEALLQIHGTIPQTMMFIAARRAG